MPDEISDLRLFTQVVAAGSLSEMARRTKISLPVVSRKLAKLESRLGVRLIDRGTRHFVLTQEGALLHDRALQIVAEIDEAESEVGARRLAPKGRLRIGMPLEIGRRRIAPMVADFVERYPGISAEVILTDASFEILGDAFDLGLHIDLPNDASTTVRKLLSSRRVVCASPDYIARFGEPLIPDDLKRHNCIRLLRGHRVYDRWIFDVSGKPREIDVAGSLSTSSSEVMHDWAIAGCGIALKAGWDVEEDIQAGRLVRLLPSFACKAIDLYAIYPARPHLPARTHTFIEYIASALEHAVPHAP